MGLLKVCGVHRGTVLIELKSLVYNGYVPLYTDAQQNEVADNNQYAFSCSLFIIYPEKLYVKLVEMFFKYKKFVRNNFQNAYVIKYYSIKSCKFTYI